MLHLGRFLILLKQNSPFLRAVSQVPLHSVKENAVRVLSNAPVPPPLADRARCTDRTGVSHPPALLALRAQVEPGGAGHNDRVKEGDWSISPPRKG